MKSSFQDKDHLISFPYTWNFQEKEFYPNKIGTVSFTKKFIFNKSENNNWILNLGRFSLKAKVYLNEHLILDSKKSYLQHHIGLSNFLREGSNTLEITINNQIDFHSIPGRSWLQKDKLGWFPYGGIFGKVQLYKVDCALPTVLKLIDNKISFLYSQPKICNDRFDISFNGQKIPFKRDSVLIPKSFINLSSNSAIGVNTLTLSHGETVRNYRIGFKNLHVNERKNLY